MGTKENFTDTDEHFVRAIAYMMRWHDRMNCKTLADMIGLNTARTINNIISRQRGAGARGLWVARRNRSARREKKRKYR